MCCFVLLRLDSARSYVVASPARGCVLPALVCLIILHLGYCHGIVYHYHGLCPHVHGLFYPPQGCVSPALVWFGLLFLPAGL